MTQDLWDKFPQLLIDKLNALLDHAPANSLKSFQLYKLCQSENVWSGSYADFQDRLNTYYTSTSRQNRKKSLIDIWLDRPLNNQNYLSFSVSFRTAEIQDADVHELAEWSHHVTRLGGKKTAAAFSLSIFFKTFKNLISPKGHYDFFEIELDDFYHQFKTTVQSVFGLQYQSQISQFINELKFANVRLKSQEKLLSSPFAVLTTEALFEKWKQDTVTDLHFDRQVSRPPMDCSFYVKDSDFLEKLINLYNLSFKRGQLALKSKRSDLKMTILSEFEKTELKKIA